MTMEEFRTHLNENGRVVIPALLRKELGLHPGDEVIFTLDNGIVQLCSRKKALKTAQALFRRSNKKNVCLSDELIAMRRREAEKE